MTSTGPKRPLFGALILVMAALCWGLGFYAQRVSIMELPPLTATAARFVIAMPVVVGALWWCNKVKIRIPWRAGAILGVLLYLVFALQTVAMLYTPVSRVALFTGLYAVFTPLLQPLFGLGRPSPIQVVAAAVAVLGTTLLCGIVGDTASLSTPPNIGDVMVLAMAVLCAALVLMVGVYAPRENPIALNAVQVLVMCGVSVVAARFFDGPVTMALFSANTSTVLSLLYLATFSTMAAFTFQIIGQRHLSPAPASIIMLLETPIGVVSAVVLLGEVMVGLQWVGAIVVLAAVVVAVVAEHRRLKGV